VRAVERVGDLAAEAQHVRGGKHTAGESLSECLALHQLHHQVVGVTLAPDIEQRADVRVVERRDRLRFALEPRANLCGRAHVLLQHLHRHVTSEPRVATAVHLSHAARDERGDDPVGAEPRAGRERHGRLSAASQFCTMVIVCGAGCSAGRTRSMRFSSGV
jgi:hypothetical protein